MASVIGHGVSKGAPTRRSEVPCTNFLIILVVNKAVTGVKKGAPARK